MNTHFTCPRRNEGYGYGVEGKDSWRDDNTCSFCGSLNPAKVLAEIEAGERVIPSDKAYKMYLGRDHKAYFQHFTEEHQIRLIKLYNEKKIRFDYPGNFYVPPFFMRFEAAPSKP